MGGACSPFCLVMTDTFDPYRKWLGIPPEDQPPHHYRLLGIEAFEADADVIANAVDGRMSQVKNYQTGKYSAQSQKILNEIAAARVCLLNSQKKAAYDKALRQRLGESEANAGAPKDGKAASVDVPQFEDSTATVAAYVSRRGKPRPTWQLPAVLVGVGLVIIAFLIYQIASSNTTTVADQTSRETNDPVDQPSDDTPVPPKPPAEDVSEQPPVEAPPESPATDPTDTADATQQPPGTDPTTDQPPTTDDNPAEQENPGRTLADLVDPENPDGSTEPEGDATTADDPATAGPKRLRVPGAEERRIAEAKIREIFADEFAKAKSAEQRQALAGSLLNQASQTQDDPPARFVLMQLATQELIKAEAVAEALAAVDEMAGTFDIQPLGIKVYYLEGWLKASGRVSEELSKTVTQTAMGLAEASAAADDYATAARFVKVAISAARKNRDLATIRQINLRRREFETQQTKHATTKEALDVLATDPNNAEANLTAGRWYCFVKDDWKKGLPYLARSSDEPLATVAKQDLAAPKTPKKQVALADGWWELAEKQGEDAKSQLQSRAEKWYRAALPKLASLEKVRVEKRLEELTATAAETIVTGRSTRGVVQKGNVALASNGTKVAAKGVRPFDKDVTGRTPLALIDGNSTEYNHQKGYSIVYWPGEWLIVFDKVYRLSEVRLKFFDLDPTRWYQYVILASANESDFVTLVDRSDGKCSGWQKSTFGARPVKAIKIVATKASVPQYAIVEFEAYCIPP